LTKALFPVGEYQKAEIRTIAAENDLPAATRHDSQDLCFLAGEDYRNFLKRNSPEIFTTGSIVDKQGNVVGRHSGLSNYTIGQRKGLGISSPEPLYVISKDTASNMLIVGRNEEMGTRELIAVNINWPGGSPVKSSFRAFVKCRYTDRGADADVHPRDEGLNAYIVFDEIQRDITPGQAAVFYNGDVVLGGGIIQKTM